MSKVWTLSQHSFRAKIQISRTQSKIIIKIRTNKTITKENNSMNKAFQHKRLSFDSHD